MRKRFDYYLVVNRRPNYRGWFAFIVAVLGFITAMQFLSWFVSLIVSIFFGMAIYARLQTTRHR